ncbi:MAG: HAD family hydrolase [Suipraeoptans sp.]
MIKAIIFDMDGLLFDSERVVQRSWNIAGDKMGISNFGDHIYNTIGLNVVGREAYFKRAVSPDFPMERFSDMTRKAFHEIADSEGIPLKPGVKELLRFAKARGYKLAVASSSRRVHGTTMIKNANIDTYFDAMIFGDMVKNAKPDPEIFLTAAKLLGLNPSEAIVLEDSPNGIKAAGAASMISFMIPDLVMPDEAVRQTASGVFDSLYSIIDLLS